jgi:hypothetical protein
MAKRFNLDTAVTPGDEDALLAAVVELHRRKLRREPETHDHSYARVLDHFERRNERLSRERSLTELLVRRTFEGAQTLAARAAHQELEIIAPCGGVAVGRFRVLNRSQHPTRVEVIAGGAVVGQSPPLSFDRSMWELDPNQSEWVRVQADLETWSKPQSCTVPIECRAAGRRDRLWLIVSSFVENGGAE